MSTANCKYCGEQFSQNWACKKCPMIKKNHCKVCHNELKHGRVRNHNVNFAGGSSAPRGTSGIDGDPDAFKRST
jgi:hypothetical protein